ncbi:MAG: copper amine oxidase N-terminal domain-containing protein, partial [Clostridiales bacterium]|nr:copper amine oxidase N-terminal domain-containing protein [Clostridiales bacterium]
MKKNNRLILVIVMICSIFINVNAYSAGLKDVVVSLQIDNPILEYNGTKYSIDDNNTTPIEKNGRTLVPIRSVIEAFGGDVSWNGDTRTATLKMDGDTVSLTIGSNTGYLNGVGQYLDVAPEIINGRTMLPIRFVAESFNLGVAWEGDTRTVTI